MRCRYLPTSVEGVVQLIAASYLRHGYYWYVTGTIPKSKKPEDIDSKLISKYAVDQSEWAKSQRRKRGLANVQYLRFGDWFILLATEGHHKLKQPSSLGGEGESIRDCRRVPIKFVGYSISYRRSGIVEKGALTPKWHAHVRIDGNTYKQIKTHFEYLAVHRSKENLALEFSKIQFARYAPIRRQLLNILRAVNDRRKQQNYELLEHGVLNLRRTPVKVFADEVPKCLVASNGSSNASASDLKGEPDRSLAM